MSGDRTVPGGGVPGEVRRRLAGVSGVVFDMDGTLVLGDQRNQALAPLPGALETTRWLAERGVGFVVLTNGTTRPPAAYARELQQLGFPVADDGVLTPASSAAAVFARRGHRRVMVLGTDGLSRPLAEAGFEVRTPAEPPDVDAVLVGWHPDFCLADLEAACHAVWSGARLYSASQSRFFATADGTALGTSRPITAAIRSVTGGRLEVVGKPSLHALASAAQRLGARIRELAVVGDDPMLEIPMAHRGRALAIAVATGIGERADGADPPARESPHVWLRRVDALIDLFEEVTPA